MSDLILKEIYSIYQTKDLTKEQIKKIQNDWKRNFWKYDNLSGDELNTKSNKNVYVENDVMTTVIKRCRGEKDEAKEKQMDSEKSWWFQNLKFQSVQNKKSNQKLETYLWMKKYSTNILLRL